MTPRARFVWALLAVTLAACGDTEGPPDRDLVDPRPRWVEGEKFRVREERERRRGTGPFPPAGELVARTRSLTREVNVYEDTIVEGAETQLRRIRRTYLRSFHNAGGADEPTVLEGRTYQITKPFGDRTFRLDVVADDGSSKKASREEEKLVRVGLWRVAASLLPAQPVRVGASWRPGRALSPLGVVGGGDARMAARLVGVSGSEGRRVARVECETDLRNQEGVHITMRESVDMDLVSGRLSGYQGLTEWYNTPARGRPETWHRISAALSVTAIE